MLVFYEHEIRAHYTIANTNYDKNNLKLLEKHKRLIISKKKHTFPTDTAKRSKRSGYSY